MKKKKSDSKDRIRTEMEYRRVKGNLEQYTKKCQRVANDYLTKGKQAAKVKNTAMMRQFAIGYRSMTEKRLAAEKILLSMESMNLDVEHDDMAGSFLDYANMFDAVSGGGKLKEKEYEKLLQSISAKDTKLNNIIDAITDRILLADESDLEEIMAEMTKEEDETELDKKLDSILEMMKEDKEKKTKKEKEEQEKKRLIELLEVLERRRGGPPRSNDPLLEDVEKKLREIERRVGHKSRRSRKK